MPDERSQKVRYYWRAALTQAAELFSEGGESCVPAMLHALRVAIHRLERYGAKADQLRPLLVLAADLDRANAGQKMRFIKPRKGHSAIEPDQFGRSGSFRTQQGLALVINELLFRSFGASRGARGPSERAAAEILRRHGFASHLGHPLTASMLRQWRVDAERCRPKLAEAREIFQSVIDGFPKEISKVDAIRFANELALHVATGPWF